MNKSQLKSAYQRVRATRNYPNSNRYAKIHVLFHELALLKIDPKVKEDRKQNWPVSSIKIKQFWKDFFGIETLTELTDVRLHEIEDFMEKKIQYEYNLKFKNVK